MNSIAVRDKSRAQKIIALCTIQWPIPFFPVKSTLYIIDWLIYAANFALTLPALKTTAIDLSQISSLSPSIKLFNYTSRQNRGGSQWGVSQKVSDSWFHSTVGTMGGWWHKVGKHRLSLQHHLDNCQNWLDTLMGGFGINKDAVTCQEMRPYSPISSNHSIHLTKKITCRIFKILSRLININNCDTTPGPRCCFIPVASSTYPALEQMKVLNPKS